MKSFPGRWNGQHKGPQGKSMLGVFKKHQWPEWPKEREAGARRRRKGQKHDKGGQTCRVLQAMPSTLASALSEMQSPEGFRTKETYVLA